VLLLLLRRIDIALFQVLILVDTNTFSQHTTKPIFEYSIMKGTKRSSKLQTCSMGASLENHSSNESSCASSSSAEREVLGELIVGELECV